MERSPARSRCRRNRHARSSEVAYISRFPANALPRETSGAGSFVDSAAGPEGPALDGGPMSAFLKRFVSIVIAIAGAAVITVAGQQQSAAPFTGAQATAGAAAYLANCATCHQ